MQLFGKDCREETHECLVRELSRHHIVPEDWSGDVLLPQIFILIDTSHVCNYFVEIAELMNVDQTVRVEIQLDGWIPPVDWNASL